MGYEMRMMMTMMAILILLTLSACTTSTLVPSEFEELKARVSALEKAKPRDAMALAEQAGTNKFWWVNSSTALAAISGASLSDGDAAFVIKSGTTEILPYIFKSGVTNTEDGYLYINDDTGNGTWALCVVGSSGVSGYAETGSHYIQVYNDGYLNSADRAEGRCWFNSDSDDRHWECFANGVIYYWVSDGNHGNP